MDKQNKPAEEELEEWIPHYQIGERYVFECPHCGEYEFAKPTKWNGCPYCLERLKKERAEE